MEMLNSLLTNEAFITLLMTLFGTLLTAIQGMKWYQNKIKGNYDKAVDVVGAAVVEVAETYTEELKKANADGKLTDEEKKIARERALEIAKQLGAKSGLNVVNLIGEELINSIIAKKVAELK